MQGRDLPCTDASLKLGGTRSGRTKRSARAREEQRPRPQAHILLGGVLQLAQRVPVQAERLLRLPGCVIKGHVRNVPEPGKRGRKPRKLLTRRSANWFPPHPPAKTHSETGAVGTGRHAAARLPPLSAAAPHRTGTTQILLSNKKPDWFCLLREKIPTPPQSIVTFQSNKPLKK